MRLLPVCPLQGGKAWGERRVASKGETSHFILRVRRKRRCAESNGCIGGRNDGGGTAAPGGQLERGKSQYRPFLVGCRPGSEGTVSGRESPRRHTGSILITGVLCSLSRFLPAGGLPM